MVDTGFRPSSSSGPRPGQVLSDDPATLEQSLPYSSSSSSTSGYLRPGRSHSRSEAETATLSPSLIPAPQPTISLISKDSTDSLSIESLTLVPPVAADRILAVGTAQSLAAESEALVDPPQP
ncbi:protein CLEC16A-like [Pseudonaja textilis]|uniref:protein CLEC16A-like n=1 Tax=Pseudonaja textilis TaxID=8673 RepID=UPI000EA88DB3|nr:protein CLEC16A-like [Pseudonaja textilis]XP_026580383.1 protein CLEC16A-like [Pseudonaja textilis]